MGRKAKPFVLYLGGLIPWIVPRGLKGWAQFFVWLALLIPLVLWLDSHVLSVRDNPDFGTGLFLFFVGVAGWLIAGLWWMLAHAEVVFVVEIRRKKQYERRERERARKLEREREQDRNREP
jgi:uncharacterized membrane protein